MIAQSFKGLLTIVHDVNPVSALGEQKPEEILSDDAIVGHQDVAGSLDCLLAALGLGGPLLI
jgi:hypothetical protein